MGRWEIIISVTLVAVSRDAKSFGKPCCPEITSNASWQILPVLGCAA